MTAFPDRTLDLAPATSALAAVLAGIRDDQLGAPTPCPDWTVGDLVDHVRGLTHAFTLAARKEPVPGGGAPTADGSRLPEGWRPAAGDALAALARAWADPAAYEGETMAGPVPMPAPAACLVALDEVVVHGWDLARATGQPYDTDPDAVAAAASWVSGFDVPPEQSPFGPPRPVGPNASALDRLVALTGRDPAWRPPS